MIRIVPSPQLIHIVNDFAAALRRVDARRPVAVNARSGVSFQAGIGPHTESQTVQMVFAEMSLEMAEYGVSIFDQAYPTGARSRCDVCLGNAPVWEWCIEVKMFE